MMKKILLWFIMLGPLVTVAQVTISVQLPPAGMIQKDQLWNLVLVNNGNQMPEITLSLNLQDAVTGQTVLSGGTRSFIFGKGVKVISLRDIQPIQYNYTAAELSASYIPMGSYVACYRVIRSGSKGPEPLADECVRLNINPLSPPQLNTPADKSVEQTIYPQFSWLPPTPSEMFSNLNYDIAIAEVLQGQTPAEAVMNNVPVYTNHNIKNPFQNYPASYTSLQPGKQYAWQVTARNGLNYSAQTDVWAFTIKPPDSVHANPVNAMYLSMHDGDNAGINLINDRNLFVKYYSFFNDHEAIVKVLSPDGKVVQEIKQKIIYGDNFLMFRLNKAVQEDKIYTLEISDPQQARHSMKFSIKQPTKSN